MKLTIFDMTGRRVIELIDRMVPSGEHELQWNGREGSGRSLGSGSYLVCMETEDQVRTSKMTLLQ